MEIMLTASLDRPGWTSDHHTGLFEAYKHKHVRTKDRTGVIKHYYEHTKGLVK